LTNENIDFSAMVGGGTKDMELELIDFIHEVKEIQKWNMGNGSGLETRLPSFDVLSSLS